MSGKNKSPNELIGSVGEHNENKTNAKGNFLLYEPRENTVETFLNWQEMKILASAPPTRTSIISYDFSRHAIELNPGIICSDIFDQTITHEVLEDGDALLERFGYPLLNYRQEVIGRLSGWIARLNNGCLGAVSRAKIIDEDENNVNTYSVDTEQFGDTNESFAHKIIYAMRPGGSNDKIDFLRVKNKESYLRFENNRIAEKFVRTGKCEFMNTFYDRTGREMRVTFYDKNTVWADPNGGLTKGVPDDFLRTLIDMDTPEFTAPSLPERLTTRLAECGLNIK